MIRSIVIIVSFLFCFQLLAQNQQTVSVLFKPVFGTSTVLQKDSLYTSSKAGSVKIETLKFYVSSVGFFKNDSLVYQEENSFHLLDVDQPASFRLVFNFSVNYAYNKLKFNLGIDSITNVSGAMGGNLDPIKGMYWAWQSGYINTKIEGKCSLCPSPKKDFQFHLGGYQSPFNPLQAKELAVDNLNTIEICVDFEHFFAEVDIKGRSHIMSPCNEGVYASKILGDCFFVANKK